MPPAAKDLAGPLRAEPELALLALVALTLPFEFTKQFFPVEWLEVSRVAMVAAIAWFFWRFFRGQAHLSLAPRTLLLVMAAVVAVEVVSFGLTRWPNAAKEVAAVAVYAIFAVVASQSIRSRRRLLVVAVCLLASALVVAALGIAEQLGNFYLWKDRPLEVLGRRNSTFDDPNITARFYVLGLIVATAVLAVVPLRPPRPLSVVRLGAVGVTLVAATAGLVLTLSRAGWALALVMLVPWAPVALRRRVNLSGPAILLIVATLAILIAVLPNALSRAAEVPTPTEPVPITGGPEPAPGQTAAPVPLAARTTTAIDPLLGVVPLDVVRGYLLRAGVAMFEDAPILGVGVGGFQPELLGPYRDFIPRDRRDSPVSLQHTDVARIAAETGVVGLAVFGALLGVAWFGLWRSARGSPWIDRVIAYGLGLLLLAIVLASQAEGRFYTEPYLWLVLAAIAGFLARGPGWDDLAVPDHA